MAKVGAPGWSESLIERTQAVAGEVAEGYVRLHAHMDGGLGSALNRTETRVQATVPGVPVSLPVLDTIRAVETIVRDRVPLVRGTLRMGITPTSPGMSRTTRTVKGLRFIADALGHVYAEDRTLGDDLTGDIWHLGGRVDRLLGTRRRPYRIGTPCPECGERSLWVDPTHLRLACGVPECRVMWAVSASVPVTVE